MGIFELAAQLGSQIKDDAAGGGKDAMPFLRSYQIGGGQECHLDFLVVNDAEKSISEGFYPMCKHHIRCKKFDANSVIEFYCPRGPFSTGGQCPYCDALEAYMAELNTGFYDLTRRDLCASLEGLYEGSWQRKGEAYVSTIWRGTWEETKNPNGSTTGKLLPNPPSGPFANNIQGHTLQLAICQGPKSKYPGPDRESLSLLSQLLAISDSDVNIFNPAKGNPREGWQWLRATLEVTGRAKRPRPVLSVLGKAPIPDECYDLAKKVSDFASWRSAARSKPKLRFDYAEAADILSNAYWWPTVQEVIKELQPGMASGCPIRNIVLEDYAVDTQVKHEKPAARPAAPQSYSAPPAAEEDFGIGLGDIPF